MVLRFAYPFLFYIFIPLLLLVAAYRWKFYKSAIYVYPLTNQIISRGLGKSAFYKTILKILRTCSLALLMCLVARPWWVDEHSHVNVEGIDIVICLDVSGSMQIFDDLNDRRPRIKVAQDEAIRFIEKRNNDPIGLVFFGQEAISRCPLTLDKNILKDLVGGFKLGEINPDGTALGTGLATSVNRLKDSKAKSKIVILLTDGEPTPGEKIEPDTAASLAKEFGIKVYTVGIGNPRGAYIQDPMFGVRQVKAPINIKLLKQIADQTGGKFFRASNPKDMKTIYNTIDRLEKTEYESNVFHRHYEAFLSFIWIFLLILGLELLLKLFWWRGL